MGDGLYSRRSVMAAAIATGGVALLRGSGLAVAEPVAAELHVSPHGDDRAAGSAERPLRTIAAARDRLRRGARSGASVVLHAGIYELQDGLELTAVDSGETGRPMTYRAATNETVMLTSGRRTHHSQFQTITNPATLKRISPELRGRILSLDVAALGLKHIQRYPDIFTDQGGIVELFANERRMRLSRYPKQGYMQMKRVLVNGGGMESAGDWKTFYDNGAPQQHKPRPGVFEYRDERTARWTDALSRGVWLKGYWRVPWQNEAVRVSAIDTTTRTITFAAAVPGGIGNKYHRPQGSGEENYWLLNLLEELTEPGEWCLDFQDKKIYFYPPAELETLDLRIADNDAPVVHLHGASHIRLTGVGVSCSRVDGVAVSNGVSNCVAGCTIRNVGHYGIRLDGGSLHEALSNDIYSTGAGGVWMGGGDETSTPRVPAAHRAVNNHIHHFGEIELVYAPGINAGYTGSGGGGHHTAVGMYVAHNMIHDGPHAGVLHGSWDHVFEWNEIFRVCRISNDMGYFYCYDLYPRSGNRTFRYNFMHNSPLADGIYFDADNRDDKLYGNVVHIGGIAYLFKVASEKSDPLQIFCWNNIAVNCKTGFRFVMRKGSDVHDNVAVNCTTPYIYLTGSGNKGLDPEGDVSTGANATFTDDPGFVNAAASDFRLKPDSAVFRELKFKPAEMPRIGLYVDEFRRVLPTNASVQRFRNPDANNSAYDILDR